MSSAKKKKKNKSKSQKKAKTKEGVSNRQSKQSKRSLHSTIALLYALLFARAAFLCSSAAASDMKPASHDIQTPASYYVKLGKFGYLRGSAIAGTRTVAAFFDVPYAAPPVGLLRFMPPTALDAATLAAAASSSTNVTLAPSQQQVLAHDFTRPKQSCRQAAPGGEDCLNLSVFAPINDGLISLRDSFSGKFRFLLAMLRGSAS